MLPAVVAGGVREPVVDDQLAIDPDSDGFVAECREGVVLGEAGLDLAGPAHAECVGIDPAAGRGGTPVLGDGFGSRVGQSGEIVVEEILPRQAGAGQIQAGLEYFQSWPNQFIVDRGGAPAAMPASAMAAITKLAGSGIDVARLPEPTKL